MNDRDYNKIVEVLGRDITITVTPVLGDKEVKVHIKGVLDSKIIDEITFTSKLENVKSMILDHENKIIGSAINHINNIEFPNHVAHEIISAGYAEVIYPGQA